MEIEYGKCRCGCSMVTPLAKSSRYGNIKGEPIKFLPGHYRKIIIPDGTYEQTLCACGCGRETKISKYNDKRKGRVLGKPIKYINGHNSVYMYHKHNTENDFWNKVNIKEKNECWEWQGSSRGGKVYGTMMLSGKVELAHRLAFLFSGGILTKEKDCVCHHCDNPLCCNPMHLFAGSDYDNAIDSMNKGRRNGKGEANNSAKLTEIDVIKIRKLCGERKTKRTEIAKLFNIDVSHLYGIISGRSWKHLNI